MRRTTQDLSATGLAAFTEAVIATPPPLGGEFIRT